MLANRKKMGLVNKLNLTKKPGEVNFMSEIGWPDQ